MSVNSYREDEEQRSVLKKDTLIRLYKYLFAYKGRIILVLLIMAVTITVSLINPLLIERAVNVHVSAGDWRGLLAIGAIAAGINLVYLIGVKLRMTIMAVISNKVLVTIRYELYTHIQKLGFAFFDSRPTGKILARLIGDVNSLKQVLSDSVTTLIPDIFTVTAIAVIMAVKDWRLSLAALITLPFLAVTLFIIQTFAHRGWQLHRKKSSNLSAFIHEEISGVRVIQSFCAEEESMKDLDVLLGEYSDSFIKAVRWADAFGPSLDVVWALSSCLLYFIVMKFVGPDNVGIGTILAFSTYMTMFWSPLRNLSNFYNQLVSNVSAAERIFDILDTQPDQTDMGENDLPEIEGRVEFEHVSFAYSDEPDRYVLNDVSFTVEPGSTIALVGPTGAGKTTIVNLISRFYDIQQGKVLIDGHNVNEVSINSLRRQLGVMTQENFIFTGTIRENIRYGRLDATDEEIEAAAKATGAHSFISKLEKGYDTELSERGMTLSIGQRQLLAFARTMLSMPRILILDEATSSIDTHTELLVQAGIEELLRGRTSFVIAHRLSTIKKADRIFYIDDGRIIEQGNHDQLMELKGAYYELYQAQFKSLKDQTA